MQQSILGDFAQQQARSTKKRRSHPYSPNLQLVRAHLKEKIINECQEKPHIIQSKDLFEPKHVSRIQHLANTITQKVENNEIHSSSVELVANLMHNLIVKPQARR